MRLLRPTWLFMLLLWCTLAYLTGCGPTVSISSVRNAYFVGTIEPVGVIVFEKNTGARNSQALKDEMVRALWHHKIIGRTVLMTGLELDEELVLTRAAVGTKGIIVIMPTGGTTYYGELINITYDVQAFFIGQNGKLGIAWRGRVSSGGSYAEMRAAETAEVLVSRLIFDRILPNHGEQSQ